MDRQDLGIACDRLDQAGFQHRDVLDDNRFKHEATQERDRQIGLLTQLLADPLDLIAPRNTSHRDHDKKRRERHRHDDLGQDPFTL